MLAISHAAAGGVGHLAGQIANARGAYVIGTASAPKHDFVRGLGAYEIIDYTQTDFAEAVQDVDIVLDAVAGDYGPRSLRTLRPGGTLVAISFSHPENMASAAKDSGVRLEYLTVESDHAGITAIATLLDNGLLRPEIAATLPLEQAAEAGEPDRPAVNKANIAVTLSRLKDHLETQKG